MSHYAEHYENQNRPGSPSSSDSDDQGRERIPAVRGRYGGLKAKQLLFAKAHQTRAYFDSAEYACALQGIVLQDVLPGGAPVDQRPIKLEPTAKVHHGRSLLMAEAPRHVEVVHVFTPQINTCDY